MTDLKFAIRQLLKTPGFSALTVLTLALGIGMNTAIFSLVNDLFLRGLSFSKPDEVVVLQAEAKERNLTQLNMSVPRFWHFRDGQTVFSDFAADTGTGFIMTGNGDPVQLGGANVTANYFDLLGVKPLRGRLFLKEEEMTADVAVVSQNFWRNRLGSDPNVVGRAVNLNGVATTIVGVIPNMPIVWWGPNTEVWTVKPFDLPGLARDRLMRGVSFMRVIGRMKPGTTIEQVRAAMPSLHQGYKEKYPENADNSWTSVVQTISENATGEMRTPFAILLAAVGAVLLIACSNVANLLLVRFTGRRREIALRMALGASRPGVVRLFVLESTLISVIAGGVGLVLALWIVSVIPRVAGDNLPFVGGIALNAPVLIFTLALSLLTGVIMGVYPAWQSSRADLVDGLKDGGRAVSGSRGQQRFRRGLVATQVGLSVVLLAGASLLIASFVRLSKQAGGFRYDNMWIGGVGMPPAAYPDEGARARFAERLQAELQTAPGVEGVSVSDSVPLSGNNSRTPYARIEGNPPPVNQRPLGKNSSISPGHFKTFGIPLLAGRDFDERDTAGRQLVVIISNSTAKKLFAGEDPIGKQMYFGTDNGIGLVAEIVGVVGDVRSVQLALTNDVEFYRPFAQRTTPFALVTVRTPMKAESAGAMVRGALNRIDPGLPIIQPNTMENVVSASLGQQRLMMTLIGGFATVALVLAAVGIYGAVAYTVEQRTGEIGVRMALGAQTMDVLRLVVTQGMWPVVIGLGLGMAGGAGARKIAYGAAL